MATETIVETIPNNEENVAENAENPGENTKNNEAVAKKRGRPCGAKDRAPRKTRVVIVEEPLIAAQAPEPPAPEPPAPEPPKAKPPKKTPVAAKAVAEQIEQGGEPEPPSPRTVLREASRSILELKRLETGARKAHLNDLYSKGSHRL